MTTDDPSDFESFGLSAGPGRDECSDLINQTIDGRYTLVERIGEGGFGCVFKAVQKSPNRPVAVKVQKYAGRESHRMAKEADLLARLDDRGIARVFEAGTWASPTGSRLYVAMELIAGGKRLNDYCDENSLCVHERLTLFREVCRAVSVAHREGIVHRDLKPGNVLVDHRGQPRVIDFGIAKLRDTVRDHAAGATPGTGEPSPDETRHGDFVGTINYAAPEQLEGEATTRSDVYALGTILSRDLLVDPGAKHPRWLGSLVARCTASDPADRPGDAGELVSELDRVLQTRSTRRQAMMQVTAIAALLVVAAVIFANLSEPTEGDSTPAINRPFSVSLIEGGFSAAGDPSTPRIAITATDAVAISTSTNSAVAEVRLSSVLTRGVRRVAFGGRSSVLAASSVGGWTAWDISETSRSTWPILEMRTNAPATGHEGLIAVSSDGSTLFAQDGALSLVAFETRTGKTRGRFALVSNESVTHVTAIAPAASADAAFVGLTDGSTRRWSLATNAMDVVGSSQGPGNVLLAAHASGSSVASCGGDGRILVLDGRSGKVLRHSKTVPGTAAALVFAEKEDVVVATRVPGTSETTVLRLTTGSGGDLVVSGSVSVQPLVTALAFSGSNTIAVFGNSDNTGVGDLASPDLPSADGVTAVARRPSRR